MTRRDLYTGLAITLFTVACSGPAAENHDNNGGGTTALAKAAWLLGNWENNSPEGYMLEAWSGQDDTHYNGRSYFIQGKDTLSSESIQLVQEGEDLFYIPTVKNQNEGKPVRFKLTQQDDEMLVFENPEHDFPQKISYRLIRPDSLVAEISGTIEGKSRAETFPMAKVR